MTERFPRVVPVPRSHSDSFKRGGNPLDFTLLGYWRWSGSDLLSNVERGVLAEFLVAQALGLAKGAAREEWGACDIVMPGGEKIEVKSSAYIQSWKQESCSKISFDIAEREWVWNPDTGRFKKQKPPKRVADVYVFCLLKHKCQETIDPLDVEQWEFYVVPTCLLDCKWPGRKRIGLVSLAGLTRATPYGELNNSVQRAIRRSVGPSSPDLDASAAAG